ncbi:hypothetical protein BDV18DRAFT_157721 [Aspergillus unguis]
MADKILTTSNPSEPRELYIARSTRRNQPEHWVLMVRKPGSERCTFYHLSNGMPPSTYTRTRLVNRRFEHWYFPVREEIAQIQAVEEVDVVRAAMETGADHCQRFVVGVVERFEGKNLVRKGTAERYRASLQPNLFEGPVRVVSEEEWDGWVDEMERGEAGWMLMFQQGYL